MLDLSREGGLRFECQRCMACCSGAPGYVWLSGRDLAGLADAFGLERDEFIRRYCVEVDTGEGWALSLSETEDYRCILLGENGCLAYGARPVQCRTYPYWDSVLESEESWKRESGNCPGIGKGRLARPGGIVEALALYRTNRPLVSTKRGSAGCSLEEDEEPGIRKGGADGKSEKTDRR